MRVVFGSFYSSLTERFNRLNSQQQNALMQMSTGQRLTNAADSPAEMQRVLEHRTSKATEQQFYRNATDANDTAKATEGSLNQLRQIFTRVQELSTRSRSDLTDPQSFKAFEAEVDQLLEQGLNVANNKLGGRYLHAASEFDSVPFDAARDADGKITNVTYNHVGTPGQEVRIADGKAVDPRTNDTENQNIAALLNNLVAVRDAMTAQDPAAVTTAANAHPGLEDDLLSSISRMGGIQYRIDLTQRQSNDRFMALENLISRSVDVDFAEASVRLSRAQTAYQASIQSGAQIANNSLLDYIR